MRYRKKPLEIEAIQWTGDARYTANIGDYIIKGINNELYVCKNDIFHITYELVEEDVVKRI